MDMEGSQGPGTGEGEGEGCGKGVKVGSGRGWNAEKTDGPRYGPTWGWNSLKTEPWRSGAGWASTSAKTEPWRSGAASVAGAWLAWAAPADAINASMAAATARPAVTIASAHWVAVRGRPREFLGRSHPGIIDIAIVWLYYLTRALGGLLRGRCS